MSRWPLAVLTAVLAVLLTACGGGGGGKTGASGVKLPGDAPSEIGDSADQWPAPNGDLQNTRVSSGEISASNVKTLGVAWTAPIDATGTFGAYASTPVIAGDTVYTQDLESNVTAYSLKTGKLVWRHAMSEPNLGPNGVALGYGKVYGA